MGICVSNNSFDTTNDFDGVKINDKINNVTQIRSSDLPNYLSNNLKGYLESKTNNKVHPETLFHKQLNSNNLIGYPESKTNNNPSDYPESKTNNNPSGYLESKTNNNPSGYLESKTNNMLKRRNAISFVTPIYMGQISQNSLVNKDNNLVNKDNSLVNKDNSLVNKDNSLVNKDNVTKHKRYRKPYKGFLLNDINDVMEPQPFKPTIFRFRTTGKNYLADHVNLDDQIMSKNLEDFMKTKTILGFMRLTNNQVSPHVNLNNNTLFT
jgi:hypothetical protein